jgi:hypothetical protein
VLDWIKQRGRAPDRPSRKYPEAACWLPKSPANAPEACGYAPALGIFGEIGPRTRDRMGRFCGKARRAIRDVEPEMAQSRKLAAGRYGDRIDMRQEISGPNGGPVQSQFSSTCC